jgi:CheY-like chemotaxis protein/HPt (histidine-containing phosphotransfer) domain-containing protein
MAKAGFAGYLSKPVSTSELLDMLAFILASPATADSTLLTRHSLREHQAKKAPEGKVRFENAQLLLAEDNPVNQQVVTGVLGKLGCRVTLAADGEEALALARQCRFDLILMDCQMPVMDGYEATKMIRQFEAEKELPPTPIIAITGNAMKGDKEKCLRAGMDDYISKPLKRGDLEQKLATWLPAEKCIPNDVAPITVLASVADRDVINQVTFDEFCAVVGDDYAKVLGRYIASAEQLMSSLRDAWSEEDMLGVMQAAHALKSPSHQIGALAFKNVLGAIEGRTAQKEKPAIRPMIDEAEAQFAAVKAALAGIAHSG